MRLSMLYQPSAIALWVGSLISVVLDQWSKSAMFTKLYPGEGSYPDSPSQLYHSPEVITSWFNLKLIGNKGAAWGIFRDLPETYRVPFFVLLSIIAMGILLTLYFKSEGQRLQQSALILIFGGAIGNLIDRVQIGYVIDFIDWHYNDYHWPTFNVADISISVGVGLLIIDMILQSIALSKENHSEITEDHSKKTDAKSDPEAN